MGTIGKLAKDSSMTGWAKFRSIFDSTLLAALGRPVRASKPKRDGGLMARRESGASALQLSLIRSTFVSGSDDIDDTDFRVKKYSQNIYQEKTSVEKMIH